MIFSISIDVKKEYLLHYKSYSRDARCLVSSIGHAEMALAEFQHKREANYACT